MSLPLTANGTPLIQLLDASMMSLQGARHVILVYGAETRAARSYDCGSPSGTQTPKVLG